MTEYMTKDEYETFIKLQDKFSTCLEQYGIEIFTMQYNHKPKGEFCDDPELNTDDRYMVQFETWSCGESDRDTVYVPKEYIYDKGYRDYYSKLLKKRIRDKEAWKATEKQWLENAGSDASEAHDRSEYERLKKKYEVM